MKTIAAIALPLALLAGCASPTPPPVYTPPRAAVQAPRPTAYEEATAAYEEALERSRAARAAHPGQVGPIPGLDPSSDWLANAEAVEREARARVAAFNGDPGASCQSASLREAEAQVGEFDRMARALTGGTIKGDAAEAAGIVRLELADAARRHGCRDVAEPIYEQVISELIGGRYAALRQRAEIGLRRLDAGAAG